MSSEKSYAALFDALQRIANDDPRRAPQLLAAILAGGPFRPFLEKPELLSAVVVLAKKYVAEKKNAAAKSATTTTAKQSSTGRVLSLRELAPRPGPPKA